MENAVSTKIREATKSFSDLDLKDASDLIAAYEKNDYDVFTKILVRMDTSPSEYLYDLFCKEDAAFMKAAYPMAKAGDYVRGIIYDRVYEYTDVDPES
jgi:hypothetical protein